MTKYGFTTSFDGRYKTQVTNTEIILNIHKSYNLSLGLKTAVRA